MAKTAQTISKGTKVKETKPKAVKAPKAVKEKAPKATKAVKESKVTKQEVKSIQEEIKAWGTLDGDQRESLKDKLLKSKFGKGGENFSIFPTLLDNKINPWVEEEFKISKLPKRVTPSQYTEWEENGHLQILPMEFGEHGKVHYMVILLPRKEMEIPLYNLSKAGDNTLEYTTREPLGVHKVTNLNYLILNIYTNKNKAYNQGKALTKLLKLGTLPQQLEKEKNGEGVSIRRMVRDTTGETYYLRISKAGREMEVNGLEDIFTGRENIKAYKDMDYLREMENII